MRRTIFILLACALAVAAALWVGTLPGAVRFEAGSLTIDASAPVIAFAVILVLAAFYLILRLLGILIRLPERMRRARAARLRRDGDTAVTRALVALAAGHQTDALRESTRARKLLGDTPHTLLLAGQANRLAGRDDDAAAHFNVLAEHKDAALLGLRGLLRMAIAKEDWAGAMALADRAERAYPGSAWLREERSRLAVRAGDWKGALALSDATAPVTAYAAAAANASDDPTEGLKLARSAWKAEPGFAPAALGYAARLRASGSDRKAQAVLQEAWDAHPHPDLAAAALDGITAGAALYAAAKRLTATTEDNLESQLVLGRAALEANELEAARAAADKAKALDQRRAWTLVADVESRIHPDSAAVRTAWQRAASAAQDPSWRCTSCLHRQAGWAAKCANCGTPGSLQWTG